MSTAGAKNAGGGPAGADVGICMGATIGAGAYGGAATLGIS
jgi:hypothetical protein